MCNKTKPNKRVKIQVKFKQNYIVWKTDSKTHLGFTMIFFQKIISTWNLFVWIMLGIFRLLLENTEEIKINMTIQLCATPKGWILEEFRPINTDAMNSYKVIIIIIISRWVARISLTLSRHSSLSFIALGMFSGQHPVSSHSCWMYVRAGRPTFARPCVGVHKSTSFMSSSLLLQQCPACLARLTWIVFVIGGRWPYSWCLVGCCCQDLFKIARSILV